MAKETSANNKNTTAASDINDNCEGNGELALTTESGRHYESVTEDKEHRCGWWSFQPDCCQLFRSPKWILIIFSIFFVLQSLTANGILPSILSSLERQFLLSSTQTGLIISSFDIAMVLCIIPLTYFGSRSHRPRCLGLGCLLYGIGCFIFAIPHYASPLYRPSALNASEDICTYNESTCKGSSSTAGSSLYFVFILGQVCQGIGAAPMFALGVSYMDESLDPKTSPIYIAILMTMSLVGTALGFGVGGQLLDLYTEFDRMDTSGLAIEPGHPTWVGAWWPGYLICAILCIIDSILIMGFPRTMPGASKYRNERESQLQRQSSTASSRKRDWQRHFHTIFTNSYFMLLCGVACFEGMIIVGYGSFVAKYIEYEFKLSTASASIYTGICLVIGGGFGMTLGGILVKKLDLDCRRAIKFSAAVAVVWFIPLITFLWHCPTANIAGVYTTYNETERFELSISNTCNIDCNCGTEYTPICDTVNGVEYFSACHAGCIDTNYTSCACTSSANSTSTATTGPIISGHCPVDCTVFLVIFLLSLVVVVILSFVVSTPLVTATIRSIPEEMRSLALGIQSFIGRIFGSIPIPIIFGALIDSTCLVWESSTGCDGSTTVRGSCQIYNLQTTGSYLFAGGVVPKLIALIFLILAGCVYQPEETTTDIALDSVTGIDNEQCEMRDSET